MSDGIFRLLLVFQTAFVWFRRSLRFSDATLDVNPILQNKLYLAVFIGYVLLHFVQTQKRRQFSAIFFLLRPLALRPIAVRLVGIAGGVDVVGDGSHFAHDGADDYFLGLLLFG